MFDLNNCTDEELVELCQKNGDDEAVELLLSRYKRLIKRLAREYFLIGAEPEDLIQEGSIGLFKALRDFKNDRNVQFRSFAKLCISRQLITAIKHSQRFKHRPLNNYLSLNYHENGENSPMELIESDNLSPESMLIFKEELNILNSKIKEDLSRFEKKVLAKYLEGFSYAEISESLGSNNKAVDNALQRVKTKLHKVNKCI